MRLVEYAFGILHDSPWFIPLISWFGAFVGTEERLTYSEYT